MTPKQTRLLFVDDERSIRETLSVILLRYGFTVSVAATVTEALQKIETQEFDLLLCDLNIERENDGLDVIRAMRKVNPHCVTIILTAYPGTESAIESIHLGIDEYIIKPAKADTLVALLAEKLTQRAARMVASNRHIAPTEPNPVDDSAFGNSKSRIIQ
ncbi:MAG TPA: response regulator [Terriglobales bacterium]|nr:response regulator [Terriglobales bacterium]